MDAAPAAEEDANSSPPAEDLGEAAEGDEAEREPPAGPPAETRTRAMRVWVAAALTAVGLAGIVAIARTSSSGAAAQPEPRTQANAAGNPLSSPAAQATEKAAKGAEREGDAAPASAPSAESPSPQASASSSVEPESAVAGATATATATSDNPPGATGGKRPPPPKRKPKNFIPSGL